MEAVFYKKGDVRDYTPSGAAVVAGQVVSIGGLAAVVIRDIADGVEGEVAVKGIFKMAKVTGAITIGENQYWDEDADPLGGVAGSGACADAGDILLGPTCYAAGATDTHCYIDLNVILPEHTHA